MAGALAALGRHDEAITAFDDVTKRAGANSLYGRMARLGKADAQAQERAARRRHRHVEDDGDAGLRPNCRSTRS